MRSLVIHGKRDVRIETIPDPVLSDADQAIVRITACGICGSDLHPYHSDQVRPPYCIGHEAIGEVVETGRGVAAFRPGDRVAVIGSISCGRCRPCRDGLVMLCANSPYPRVYGQGIPGLDGCQAEALTVSSADFNLIRLPSDMSDEVGIMLTDNLPTAWHSAKRARVGSGSVVAVIGLGAVGLQAVISAFALGAERVFAIDLIAERRAQAEALGAEAVADDVVETILAQTNGRGVDVAIEAVGVQATIETALRIVAKGGVVSVIGVPEQHSLSVPTMLALTKNAELLFTSCSVQAQIPDLFGAFESGRIDPSVIANLVSHRMALADGAEAYRMFDARADGIRKVILTP